MRRRFLLFCLAAVASGCAANDYSHEIDALRSLVSEHETNLDAAEGEVANLTAFWADVVESYRAAHEAYEAARRNYEEASASASRASSKYREASAEFQKAEALWMVFQKLILIAAAIDAANLDSYRQWRNQSKLGDSNEPFSCEQVSLQAFRRRLEHMGVDLTGLDVDHIVPTALGGANHPSNYQLLPSSENRALRDTWNMEKCDLAGDRCLEAIAVSRECGSYRGLLPP